MKVLRPDLYRQLALKHGRVKVSKVGEKNVCELRTDEKGYNSWHFDKDKGHEWGEYYRICCPICHDTKFRLSINHVWGYVDKSMPLVSDRSLRLISCHRRNCFDSYQQCKVFYDELWNNTGPQSKRDDVLHVGKEKDHTPGEMQWPGTVWPLTRLPPDHAARLYLEGRKFNPDWLAEQFGVGFLMDPILKFGHLRGRLIIPVFFGSKIVGWTSRRPTENLPTHEGKYYHMPGMSRQHTLYNFDIAKQFPFVVLEEGPTDVWRFGPEAVAALGKPTSLQLSVLRANWKKIVILLDEDAMKESRELFNILSQSMPGNVAEIRLPEGMDPGKFACTSDLRRYVANSLVQQKFSLEITSVNENPVTGCCNVP